jgi:hypothetical protein
MFSIKSLIIETRTTKNNGMKMVGFPPDNEMIGMVCRIPMKRK